MLSKACRVVIATTVWPLIDPELEGDVLSHMQDAVRAEFLEQMHPDKLADATKMLDVDDVADILQDLPDEVADTVLRSMDEQNVKRLSSVLTYPGRYRRWLDEYRRCVRTCRCFIRCGCTLFTLIGGDTCKDR